MSDPSIVRWLVSATLLEQKSQSRKTTKTQTKQPRSTEGARRDYTDVQQHFACMGVCVCVGVAVKKSKSQLGLSE